MLGSRRFSKTIYQSNKRLWEDNMLEYLLNMFVIKNKYSIIYII